MSNVLEILERIRRKVYSPTLVAVSHEKIVLANGAYVAEDVVSENTTAALGAKFWSFPGMAKRPGGQGYIVGGFITAETTAIASWFSLFLHTDEPTCAVGDGIPNTAFLLADRHIAVPGPIDFPACSDLGTGMSSTVATASTVGNLPIPFVCKSGSTTLTGPLVIRNAVDLADTTILRVTLFVEQL